jgi:hypothetical protein
MNRRYSFYRESDGHFIGRRIMADPASVKQKTPAGCVAMEGYFDRHAQRVDLASGRVVEDASLGTARTAQRQSESALRIINELELRSLRRLREILATEDPMLKALDDQVAELRAKL